ncbi:hypothetical protein F2P79_010264 [Pimephales promelas]|nr:hypothetical protein F2P79_010264 [Pimephales promelas]
MSHWCQEHHLVTFPQHSQTDTKWSSLKGLGTLFGGPSVNIQDVLRTFRKCYLWLWERHLLPGKISAFVTPDSFLQYKRMAFSLRNAPATFQRLMSTVLGKQVVNGQVWSLDGIVAAVLSYPVPTTRRELRRFLGMVGAPVLPAPDVTRPFQLEVDASAVGVGAVLLQEGSSPAHLWFIALMARAEHISGVCRSVRHAAVNSVRVMII